MKILPLDRPLLANVRAELNALRDDLQELVLARWELAQLEIESDLRAAKRLAIVWVAAVLMVLTSLPLVFVLLADVLAGCCDIPRFGWLLIFVAGLLTAAGAGSLAETLEECREDLLWLREKAERKGDGG